jgi:hypothetical protein
MSENIERVKPVELTANELEIVSGGVSLNFSTIELTYVKQTSDGAAPATKPSH